jgi:hypothetical protein
MNAHKSSRKTLYYKFRLSSQNYWVFGPFPSPGILENRKHDVSETDLFPSSCEGQTAAQLGPLERANVKGPN